MPKIDQRELASSTVDLLSRSGSFEDVQIIGSVATGGHDRLSDIDILISDSRRPSWENVQLASDIVADALGVLFRGWSGSLIPEKYLINHFLPNYPLFWWIDIGCAPNSAYGDISRGDIDEDRDEHLAKLLIMNAKHFLRRDSAKLKISELYIQVFPGREPPGDACAMFEAVYGNIDYSGIAEEFREKTLSIMTQVTANNDGVIKTETA